MRIAIIADAFPPMRTSAAVQLRDLAAEFIHQGHSPTVLIPSSDLDQSWTLEAREGLELLRLRAPRSKDVGYIRRTLAELAMPFSMLRNLRRSPLAKVQWDGVIWYSPTIFLGPIVGALCKSSDCPSYLILRDIFPEWAVDMGLMKRGLPYRFFKWIEHHQYSVAHTIGVQTPANLPYFEKWAAQSGRRVEVLKNWMAAAENLGCSINVTKSQLSGRKIFVYAGNMGIAQGMDIMLELAQRVQERKDIGFIFVGRGSETERLRRSAEELGLNNTVFYDEIDPSEIAGLYAQCHVGLVSLDRRHKTHNVPGKFLSYMEAGIPVLASLNPGNDLIGLIQAASVGRVCSNYSVDSLSSLALALVDDIADNPRMATRCKQLFNENFSPRTAVEEITRALAPKSALPSSSNNAGSVRLHVLPGARELKTNDL